MKSKFPIITTAFAGAGLLAGAIYAGAQQPPTAAAPPVDPASHAAHVASGAMPPDAAKADPALAQQIADLQAKVTQLQTNLGNTASDGVASPNAVSPPMPPAAQPVPPAVPMPPAAPPAMSMGMGKMKPAAAMPGMDAPAPAMAGMMPMMEKMMGMMDKMMGMGAAPMAAPASMAGMPAAAPMPAGGMGMPMMDKMKLKMEKMMGKGAGAMPPAAPMEGLTPIAPTPARGMDKMKMSAMMGMGPMGAPAPGTMPPSALPGFPGASHLYHIGATDFFLDHQAHIALTTEQTAALSQAKERATLAKSTADRTVEQAEQDLYALTASDQPDIAAIEAKTAEIGKLSGAARVSFIRAVGEASKTLTDEQRKVLTGFAPPAPADPVADPAAAMAPMKGM